MRFESARADRITAVVFFALGAAMAWGGFAMDRLEIRQIHPASIPGLVPMFLGVALMSCAAILFYGAKSAYPDEQAPVEGSWTDFLAAAGWSVFFALILVGNMPFAVATTIYILGFTGWFLWHEQKTSHRLKFVLLVAFFSVTSAVAISALFRYGFLVRLP